MGYNPEILPLQVDLPFINFCICCQCPCVHVHACVCACACMCHSVLLYMHVSNMCEAEHVLCAKLLSLL